MLMDLSKSYTRIRDAAPLRNWQCDRLSCWNDAM